MDSDSVTRKDFSDIQELVRQNIALSEENNKILRSMQKWNKISFIAKVVIWGIVIIVPVVLYPYIKEFIPVLSGASGVGSTTDTGLFGYPSTNQIEKVVNPGQ